jgi:hypothetical protein
MRKRPRYYNFDGKKYLVREASYDMAFKIYKSDRRRAISMDMQQCLLALGIKRHPDVLDCKVCSNGDVFVLFKETEDEPAYVVHFRLRKAERDIIDLYDGSLGKKVPPTSTLILRRPPPSHTLGHRDALNQNLRARRAAGQAPPTRRKSAPRVARITRIGVRHRKRAELSFSAKPEAEEQATV